MTHGHRLVVALTGRDEDAALIRYANALAAQNDRAAHVLASSAGRRAAGPGGATPVLIDDGEELVLSTPRQLEYVRVESGRSREHLLALAADSATEAVLVSEAIGRRTVRTLVRQAACSVWFVPDRTVPGVRRILVPVAFSVRSADCLRVATVLARLSGAACLALHVYFNDCVLAGPEQDRLRRMQLAEAYARFVAPIDLLDVPVVPRFEEAAHVGRAINRTATDLDADLIVLASRGRTWAGAFLHESVAEQTLRECRVPMLVLKHFGAQLGLLRVLREPSFRRQNDLRFN
jgi:nucleotide-binding universal stress UspA family protein